MTCITFAATCVTTIMCPDETKPFTLTSSTFSLSFPPFWCQPAFWINGQFQIQHFVREGVLYCTCIFWEEKRNQNIVSHYKLLENPQTLYELKMSKTCLCET